MESTQKKKEDILVKKVDWYKSVFKVVSNAQIIYQKEIDPKTNQQVQKQDLEGNPIPKRDKYNQLIYKPYP